MYYIESLFPACHGIYKQLDFLQMQTFQYFQKYKLSKKYIKLLLYHGLSEYLILIGWQVGRH